MGFKVSVWYWHERDGATAPIARLFFGIGHSMNGAMLDCLRDIHCQGFAADKAKLVRVFCRLRDELKTQAENVTAISLSTRDGDILEVRRL